MQIIRVFRMSLFSKFIEWWAGTPETTREYSSESKEGDHRADHRLEQEALVATILKVLKEQEMADCSHDVLDAEAELSKVFDVICLDIDGDNKVDAHVTFLDEDKNGIPENLYRRNVPDWVKKLVIPEPRAFPAERNANEASHSYWDTLWDLPNDTNSIDHWSVGN